MTRPDSGREFKPSRALPIACLALASLLLACGQQSSTPAVDPAIGRACFESLRTGLPPGTQYEGIEKSTAERITIKIMNGVTVTTAECGLNPDGSLQ
ncbi:MAG: hypothetical protein R3308_00145 [Thiohalobacterales bacterium]|nr:hypothetical protein [Thiohalobacterales bacterium]